MTIHWFRWTLKQLQYKINKIKDFLQMFSIFEKTFTLKG